MKMPFRRVLAWSVLCLGILAGNPAMAAEVTVTVSVLPQKAIVEAIGGDAVDVQVMVRPGANPATYEPSPKQMARLNRSALYFAIGVPFEGAWLPRLTQGNADMEVVHLQQEVARHPMPGERGSHDHTHGQGTPDPHIWLSPNMVRAFSASIAEHLAEALPSQAEAIRARHLDFVAEVASLDAELAQTLRPLGQQDRRFLVFHPSWGYFARDYGLKQVPVQLEGKDPSPKDLQQLVRLAEEHELHTVFVQPQFSKKTAAMLAEQIDARVVELDPLAENWAENLRRVAEVLVRELS
ncbi:MAG: metal ABC transporter solute-binding protein, Zn/Mn family [Thermodesulfobacteriota bacterium]